MSMTAADWMESSYYKMRNHNAHDPEYRMIYMSVRPWAVCADGTIISLQGSPCHYSKPKEFTSKYISVEVGLLDFFLVMEFGISTEMLPWMMTRDSSVSMEAL